MNIRYFKYVWGAVLAMMVMSCEQPDPRPESKHAKYCNCNDKFGKETLRLRTPMEREEKLLDEVLKINGIVPRPYRLCSTKEIPGDVVAYATFKDNMFYIVYDKAYFQKIDSLKAFQILAHEVGHHVHNHVFDNSIHQHKQELEAERYSGSSMYRRGIDLEDALKTNSILRQATETHPSGKDRRQAIKTGWLDASKMVLNHPQAHSPPPPNRNDVKQLSKENIGEPYSNDTSDILNVITNFIEALGNGNFKRAYSYQSVESWGDLAFFSSTKGFGGITETEVITPPLMVDTISINDNQLTEVKLIVKYYSTDPINDKCSSTGKTYEQYFWVKKSESNWTITKAKLKEMQCGKIQ